jgi:hypothetical protein
VETYRPLEDRSYLALLTEAAAARMDGLVVLRDRTGDRHGVFLEDGYVRSVQVAGRFDPLLDLLEKRGEVDRQARRVCLGALRGGMERSGAVATHVLGLGTPVIRDALRSQQLARLAALLELAEAQGHDAGVEPGAVAASDCCVRLPLGFMLRALGRQEACIGPAPASPENARKRLRALARALHPDRHANLTPEARRELELALARATAAYHGFEQVA